MDVFEIFRSLIETSGLSVLFTDWRQPVMILLALVLLYLGLVKKFEPLLLIGIAFGMLLTNLPGAGLFHPELWDAARVDGVSFSQVFHEGGLLDFLYFGLYIGLYPSLIFLGVGAMTDFGPLIANKKSMFLGAAAQLGIYCAFILAVALGFTGSESAAIGIIGSADGPTALFLTSRLAPHLLGAVAIAAYSYMALIPLIQPPFMRLLTTKKERET
ncbi:MAG: sodium ion-translocating decarboxylase subunit beta, partial [Oscillospiraceae bacterium]|nr:sodium ion-translocating decarboxylase subunit beta [Oscillospiraceae bacterium]